MNDDDANAPATKADIRAVLTKLDGMATTEELSEFKDTVATEFADIRTTMATKDDLSEFSRTTKDELADLRKEMATGFAEVNHRLDLLNEEAITIVNNLANNVNRIDERIVDHEARIGQLEEGKKELLAA